MTLTEGGLPVGAVTEDWATDARYFEYTAAADPIRSGHTPRVPIRSFPSAFIGDHGTGIEHLDLSAELGTAVAGSEGPATSPALLASFVHIRSGEALRTSATATSELHVVLRGSGVTELADLVLPWSTGDVVVLPAGAPAVHRVDAVSEAEAAVIYRVTDEPLLRYLGVAPVEARFGATRWEASEIRRQLDLVASDPRAADRNRVSVLLAGASQPQTLTATHVLWAMFGLLPVGAVQRPHRHQSVALDLIVDCRPGCHTLVGDELDERGDIVDPVRVDWEPGAAFVTPPGLWHAHVNDSGAPAHLFPVQDAGLHTYLRSLDIRFVR
ncbi:cupin domain-containing protein [Dermatobacter hominis]|uniref:cupin domain-containing protein n=1 Tax=Dermatobacter hominis TaxID=2884263 RepID=UPI001D109B85|nr:cupin domain-containing protein [Dermatobacter hominis]UDY35250.1 cupin domain-containing protein [Dermatobacter hominis]